MNRIYKIKEDCCGCSACVSICHQKAISFVIDEEGFKYPQIHKKLCNDCGLCESVCPILNRKITQQPLPNTQFYAVRLRDLNILECSSSGGAFYALSKNVLLQRGVVYGVSYTDALEVVHSCAETFDDFSRFHGSKYVQSNIDGIFNDVKKRLQSRQLVLFSGTPCQVDGLKRYLIKSYDNLITVDLLCHAVPSPLVFKNHIQYLSKKYSDKLINYEMRYKGFDGWKQTYSYKFTFMHRKSIVNACNVVNWGGWFFSKLLNRPSCYQCKFSNFYRPGDFTIGDFWDHQGLCPEILSDRGTSIVMLNTDKAKKIFTQIQTEIDSWPVTKEEATQTALLQPVMKPSIREEFWDYYLKQGYEAALKKYFNEPTYRMFGRSIKNFFRRTSFQLKRIYEKSFSN